MKLLDVFQFVVIPIVGGAAGALRGSEWARIGHFFVENQQWFISAAVWLGMLGLICLFVEGATPKIRRVKRIVGTAVITLWVWGAALSGLLASQVPDPPRHISPPIHWYWGGNS